MTIKQRLFHWYTELVTKRAQMIKTAPIPLELSQLNVALVTTAGVRHKADLDCVFPLRTLLHLADTGVIGSAAPVHFGFMGYIPDIAPLQAESIPALITRLRETGASAVLLSPG